MRILSYWGGYFHTGGDTFILGGGYFHTGGDLSRERGTE